MSATAQQNKDHCSALLVGTGTCVAARRVLLLTLANGDWQCSGEIQHYINGDPENDEDMLRSEMADGLTQALCSRAPHIYPRHRWTGADLSVDQLALMTCLHSLLRPVYCSFMEKFGKQSTVAGTLAQHVASNPMIENAEAQALHAAGSESELDEGDFVLRDVHSMLVPEAPWKQKATAAALNAKSNKLAFQWLQGHGTLAVLMLLRKCLEPFRVIMSKFFVIASKAWDLQQQAKTATEMASGLPCENPFSTTSFRITEACELHNDRQFMSEVKRLTTTADVWKLSPKTHFAVRSELSHLEF